MYLRLNIQREVLFSLLYIVLCNLTLINYGATLGYSSVVLPILTSNTSSITLNAKETSLFVSIINISAIFGCLLCFITMNYGRRCTMLVYNVLFSLGWSLIASSYNVTQLFIGRTLTGIAMGLSSYLIEVYLAEISIDSWKQITTIIPNIAGTVGILIVYLLGFVIQNNWRLIAAFFILSSILLVLCNIFFIRESPVWLLLKGRNEEARVALLHIRGLRQETIEFKEEFARMVTYNESINNIETSRNCCSDPSSIKDDEKRSSFIQNVWSKLKSIEKTILLPEVWKPFVILNLYFFFQKFSGLDVMISYTVDMITRVNITIDPFLITVIVGIIQVIGNVITCCSTIIKIGRRGISIASGAGMSISLGALAVYLEFFEDAGIVAVPLVCILLYVAFGSFGFSSLPYSMIPELYPIKYINVLGTLSIFIKLLFGYIIKQLYPIMVTQDKIATIYFFCIISIMATFFLTIALPETREKTKTQIEEAFRDKLQFEGIFRKNEDACYTNEATNEETNEAIIIRY